MILRRERRDTYTTVDNITVTDARLSFKALGVLVYLLSRPDTWEAHYRHLATVRPDGEGEYAIRGALGELTKAGYLERRRDKDPATGQWRWVQVIREVPTTGAVDAEIATHAAVTAAAVTHAAETAPITKTEGTKNEEQPCALVLDIAPAAPQVDTFDRFWQLYPRKRSKGQAQKAWRAAIKTADPEAILAGLARYNVLLPEEQFIPYPATWLNGERWADDMPAAPDPVDDLLSSAFAPEPEPTCDLCEGRTWILDDDIANPCPRCRPDEAAALTNGATNHG